MHCSRHDAQARSDAADAMTDFFYSALITDVFCCAAFAALRNLVLCKKGSIGSLLSAQTSTAVSLHFPSLLAVVLQAPP